MSVNLKRLTLSMRFWESTMPQRLAGQRVLITQADDYMGPATQALFAEEGAVVIADTRDLTIPGSCEALIADAGRVDVFIANLASPNFSGIPAHELEDSHGEARRGPARGDESLFGAAPSRIKAWRLGREDQRTHRRGGLCCSSLR